MLRRAFAKNSPTMAKNIAAYISPNAFFVLRDLIFVDFFEFAGGVAFIGFAVFAGFAGFVWFAVFVRFENLLFVSVDFVKDLEKDLIRGFARLASLVGFRITILYFLEMKFGFYLWRGGWTVERNPAFEMQDCLAWLVA